MMLHRRGIQEELGVGQNGKMKGARWKEKELEESQFSGRKNKYAGDPIWKLTTEYSLGR